MSATYYDESEFNGNVTFHRRVKFFGGIEGLENVVGIASITVVQTGYTGSNPIAVSNVSGTTQIGIGTTSNAYATRTVSTLLPGGGASPDNSIGNNGDIWYQIV